MGHRSFRNKTTTKQSSSRDDSTNSSIGGEGEKMNGLKKITEEQTTTVAEVRSNIRDRVSMKMGDLLLRGYTMLNAYCDVCSGILMEDRQGVRVCVTCDLLKAELNLTPNTDSRAVAETPFISSAPRVQQTECLEEEPSMNLSNTAMKHSKEESLKQLDEIGSDEAKRRQSVDDDSSTLDAIRVNKPKMRFVKSVPMRSGQPSPGVECALAAVDEKLRWCGERLAITQDVNEILLLHKAIRSGIEIIEHFSV
uniref:Sjoegren syndrome/scleroderma autoantigen 1 n=1 Tax=Parascaris univalens TaxID=6257 RepID=A0A915AMD0_PARUN